MWPILVFGSPTLIVLCIYLFGFINTLLVYVMVGKLNAIKVDVLLSGDINGTKKIPSLIRFWYEKYDKRKNMRRRTIMGPGSNSEDKLLIEKSSNLDSYESDSLHRDTFVKQESRFCNFFAPLTFDLKSLEHHYGNSYLRKHEHHKRFWGEGSHYMLSLVRKSSLITSIYSVIIFGWVFPAMVGSELSFFRKVLGIIIGIVPAALVVYMLPTFMRLLSFNSSIQSMRNSRLVAIGQRRVVVRNALNTIKVLYMLTTFEPPPSDFMRVFENTGSQTHYMWDAVFKIFDTDRGGSVTFAELSVIFNRIFAQDVVDGRIKQMMEHMDEDSDGEIDFDEFYQYVMNLLEYNKESIQASEIANGIFELVDSEAADDIDDDDEEDVISVTELQSLLQKCGLGQEDISVDDLYTMICEFDHDDNGFLDREEFFSFLIGLRVLSED